MSKATKRSTKGFNGLAFLSTKQAVGSAHPATAEIASLTFKGVNFPDEKSVKEWLDTHGYENYKIETVTTKAAEGEGDETSFTVAGMPKDSFEGDLGTIEVGPGVTAEVGKIKAPTETEKAAKAAEGEAPADPAEPAAEPETPPAADPETPADPVAPQDPEQPAAEPVTEPVQASADPVDPPAATEPTEAEKAAKGAGSPAVRVITVKSDADREAVTAAVEACRSLAKKYSSWMAECSDDKTLAEVMACGADGLPPGIYEVNTAFYAALRNCIISKDMGAVRSLVLEFGDMITEMATVFSAATIPGEYEEVMTSAFAVTKADAKPLVQKTTKTTDAPAVLDAAAIASIVQASMAPVAAAVATLAETVKTNHETTTASIAKVEKDVGDRVAALGGVRQTRKSGDGLDGSTNTPVQRNGATPPPSGLNDPLRRGAFGITGSRPRQ